MVAFGHTAVGTLVGLAASEYFGNSNPTLGLTLAAASGVVSHYITDFIPHGHLIRHRDFKKKVVWEIIFDLSLSIALIIYLAYLKDGLNLRLLYILFGIGGSQLPDILDGLYYIGCLKKKGFLAAENNLHVATHWHGRFDKALMWGKRDVWQICILIITIWVLLR